LVVRRQASQRACCSHEDRPMNIPFIRRLVGALGVVARLGGLASTGWAQQGQQGTITGVVTDQLNSLPVAGARILLGNTNRTVLTNATGRYTLAAVPAGSYELRVVAVGFASQTHGVQPAAGGSASAGFTLAGAGIPLDEVVVTATGEQRAREAGNAITNIDVAKAIETQNVMALRDSRGHCAPLAVTARRH